MNRRQFLGTIGSAVVCTAVGRPVGAGARRPEFVQRQRLTPTDGEPGDEFGERVVLGASGTTLLATTQSDADPNGRLSGSAYLFERTDAGFTQRHKVVPDDGDSQDFFGLGGIGMSADGTTMFVGAVNDEDPNGPLAGSGYVFERTGDDVTQRAKVAAPDGRENDRFGDDGAVSPDGNAVVVGAPGRPAPDGERLAGVAFAFERTTDGFAHRATLSPPTVDGGDLFGTAVAVGPRTVVVGASGDEDTGGDTTGAVYVYDRTTDPPALRQTLTATAPGTDGFGSTVALSAGTLVVGVGGARAADGTAVGGVSVYRRTDGTFDRVDEWVRPEGSASDNFPESVALDGSTVTVTGANAGYAVALADDRLGDTQRLVRENDDGGDNFGNSVTVDAGTVAVGAPDDEDPNGSEAGTVYVFGPADRTPSTTPSATPTASSASTTPTTSSPTARETRPPTTRPQTDRRPTTASPSAASDGSGVTSTGDDGSESSPSASEPGFGVLATLAAGGLAGYRWLSGRSDEG